MAQSAIKELIDSFGYDVVEAAQRVLGATRKVKGKNRRAVATGTLKDSLTFVNRTRRGLPIIDFTAKEPAKEYAGYVHGGRRAGARQPPIAPIEAWIKVRGIRPKDENGKFVKSTPARIRGMAFAISRSIGINGIEPLPYYTEAIESVLEKRGPDFLAAIKKDIETRLLLRSKTK
jgi:hypothetical protein